MKKSSFLAILCILGLLLALIAIPILPTMDDWVCIDTPQPGVPLWRLLMPIFSFWRPFDGVLGYINGLDTSLFPTFNHIVIIVGHTLTAWTVHRLALRLGFGTMAAHLCALFFMLTPGMLGAVLDVDSANQVYSTLFGLLAILHYLNHTSTEQSRPRTEQSYLQMEQSRLRTEQSCLQTKQFRLRTEQSYLQTEQSRLRRLLPMALLVFIGTLWKENCMAFIAVAPLLAWGFRRISLRCAMADFGSLLLLPLAYVAIRFSLPTDQVDFNAEYVEGGLMQRVRNAGIFVVFSWLPLDFVSIVHAPTRSIPLAAISVLLASPFVVWLLTSIKRLSSWRPLLTLLVCMLGIGSIHLLTVFTAMHTYSSLTMVALCVALLIDRLPKGHLTLVAATWLIAALFSDAHHALCAYESGQLGRRMAKETLAQIDEPVDSVMVVNIDHNTPHYSTFCVAPFDAFGYGIAALYENDYKWPTHRADTTISETAALHLDSLQTATFSKGYDQLWLVDGEHVKVLTTDNRQ